MMREPATSAFPYIKLKTYKTVVIVGTLEKWKRWAKPHQSREPVHACTCKKAAPTVGASVKPEPHMQFVRLFHEVHNSSTAAAKDNCVQK
jgi:hypothetical protein